MSDVTVGWDGSAVAARAADWAARRQRGRGRLQLLQVRAPQEHERGAADRAALEAEVGRLRREHPTLLVSGAIEHGDVQEVLAGTARDGAVLVLGAHLPERSSQPARSLAIRVAAAAQGRVVVVPDASARERGDRVVVGVDGSAASIEAALAAAVEAEGAGQPLVLVHAWWVTVGRGALLPFRSGGVDALEAAHRAVLDECADTVARRHPGLEVARVLVHGPVAEALAETARYASLVVLGRHAGTVVVPALLGSAARGVLQRSAVPTMVVGASEPRRAPAPFAAVPAIAGV